jgi:hypothetical protein
MEYLADKMSTLKRELSGFPIHMVVAAVVLGSVVGVLLLLVNAPLWAFYAASACGVPLVLYEFHKRG